MKHMVRRSIITSSFIIFPILGGLAIIARPLIEILLTDKWLNVVPFLQIMCFTYAFYLIDTANLQAIKSIGRTDVYLKLEIMKKMIGVIVLAISVPFGIMTMVMLQPIYSIVSNLINTYPNKKFLGYSIKQQYKDILPSVLLTAFMGIIIYPIKYIIQNNILLLLVQVLLGAIIYILVAYILKLDALMYLLNTLKDLIKKKRKENYG